MRIAVTGGNGELGRTLVPYLLAQNHDVVSIDRVMPPLGSAARHQAQQIVADTRDFGQLVGSLRSCDALIHLAAHRAPGSAPDTVVYADNTISSYNVLSAAATLGITRVCLASSINAIGGVFSRAPHYDYFPLDEQHPTYTEDPYSLSKWVLEQQADAFARRFEAMQVASLRFHWLIESRAQAIERTPQLGAGGIRHLWGYTLLHEAARACLLALTAHFTEHQVFYITAPRTAMGVPSRQLAQAHYPSTPIRGELAGTASFFDCRKAAQLLGWEHEP